MQEIATVQYVTSSEGERLLGVKRSTFFYYVESGQIATEPGREKRDGRYSLDDIKKVKEKRKNKRRKPISTVVDWMRPTDMPNTLKLDFLVFEEAVPIGDINLYISWLRKNPYLTFTAFDANDRSNVLAYISLIPLPEEVIHQILRGERTETTIKPEEIETYERPGEYTLLAEGAVAHPDHPEMINTVLRAILSYWCEQYPYRHVRKIYAQAASAKGDVLIQKFYFAPRYDLADSAYVLDLKRPGASKVIRHFQECLARKEQEKAS